MLLKDIYAESMQGEIVSMKSPPVSFRREVHDVRSRIDEIIHRIYP